MKNGLEVRSTDSVQVSLPVAGVGSRSYAFVIDWHIRTVLALGWFFSVWLVFWLLGLEDGDPMSVFQIELYAYIAFLPMSILYFLYHPVLEIVRKQTPGKRIAAIRIVTLEGRTPTANAMLIRNVFRIIDALPSMYLLGLIVAFFTRNQVRIGDIAAGTLLVHQEKTSNHFMSSVVELTEQGDLSLAESEFLFEFLERWGELETSSRIRLAEKFLKQLGKQVDTSGSYKQRETRLKTQLESFISKEKKSE